VSFATPRLRGNRLALLGVVLYFMEWVVIPIAPSLPTDKLGQDPALIAAAYAHHPSRTALLAGWLSFVLLGRVLFVGGLRDAVRDSPRATVLLDWAFGAMVVSVVIEIVDYALVASGAWLAHANASADSIAALDTVGTVLVLVIFAPFGASVLAASLGLLASHLFRPWVCWLGVVAGTLLTAGGIIAAAAKGSTGSFHDVGGALASSPVPLVWIWLIVTGVIVWRAPRKSS
jgi:hypothetical protein